MKKSVRGDVKSSRRKPTRLTSIMLGKIFRSLKPDVNPVDLLDGAIISTGLRGSVRGKKEIYDTKQGSYWYQEGSNQTIINVL